MSGLIGIITGVGVGGAAGSILDPVLEQGSYAINSVLQGKIFDPQSLAVQRIRNIIPQDVYYGEMAKNGFTNGKADALISQTQQFLDLNVIIALERKGKITHETALQEASFIGVVEAFYDATFQATLAIPSLNDIITFSDRRIFDGKYIETANLNAELPKEAIAAADRVGVDKTAFLEAWAAHWKTPQLQVIFDAFFRYSDKKSSLTAAQIKETGVVENIGDVAKQAIDDVLIRDGILPQYRDIVKSVMFSPINRREMLHMVSYQLIDFDTAVYNLQRNGLNGTDSELLAQALHITAYIPVWKEGFAAGTLTDQDIIKTLATWRVTNQQTIDTVMMNIHPIKASKNAKAKQLTESQIVKAFLNGEIKPDEAIGYFKKLNVDEKTANLILQTEYDAHVTNKKANNDRHLNKSDILRAYAEGLADKDTTIAALQGVGYSAGEAAELIAIQDARPKSTGKKSKSSGAGVP